MRWSSLIQTAAFFAVLTLYFLTPPLANPHALAAPENRLWYALVPSYWFFGLFQVLTGSTNRGGGRAGAASAGRPRALRYRDWRLLTRWPMRGRCAAPWSSPASGRSHGAPLRRWAAIAAAYAGRRAPERAILVSSDARWRAAGSIACCWPSMPAWDWRMCSARWLMCCIISKRPTMAHSKAARKRRSGIPLILLFFLIVGLRVSFSIPIEVRANWLFRLTDPFGERRVPERRAQDAAVIRAGAGGGHRGAVLHGRVALAESLGPRGIPGGVRVC